MKNNRDRLVVLNKIARDVVNSRRNIHHEYVFSYRGKRLHQILNTGWKNARLKLGLKHLRVHDLKHTYGSRLRAANVSFEDRQDLLGHKSNRITTDYSAAELQSLINASEKVCLDENAKKPSLVLVKKIA